MPKPSDLISIVDKYLLENWEDIQKDNDVEYGKWNRIASIITKLNNLSELISNDYICRRHKCIKAKLKKGKTVEGLLKPRLSTRERKRINSKRWRESEKGKAFKKQNNYYQNNKEVLREKAKIYRKNNEKREKERSRENLIKAYGITPKDYNKIFEEQKGCCAICERHQTEFKKKLSIDHNHNDGQVRGLLCHNCNVGLGNFKDDIELMKRGIDYLNKYLK